MKKIVVLLICLIILTGCKKREDYFELGIDDYSISVGYDDVEYLKTVFDFDIKDTFNGYEEANNVDINFIGNLFGIGNFTNFNKKEKESNEAILNKLTIYVNDLGSRIIKLNGEPLDSSIKNSCDKYGGSYIEKNGKACVIESNVNDQLNVVELYGDYLNINQDQLDHIIIYVK